LTPYYLFEDDVRNFHCMYHDLCDEYLSDVPGCSYQSMKQECDAYFYLSARSEHRGTGGIFFDVMEATENSSKFVKAAPDPRVEGIMVLAPPLIAWEYKHVIEEGSDEAKLMEVLKKPRDWIDESI
jgi:coproporphyrinogen III oxidase